MINRKALLASIRHNSMSTTPGDAAMLRILIETSRARRGVEIGVFSGYGAINMGLGFERTGGRLFSIESDPERAAEAERNVRKARLSKTVSVIEGDALEVLPAMKGRFDFVFIDAIKRDYLKYLKAIEPKLKAGAVVVADNVIRYAAEMPDFLRYIQTSSKYDTVLIRASMEKGDGMTVSCKVV
ncbi:MAG: O-methyltransferase [Bryobacteraceae bacterium]